MHQGPWKKNCVKLNKDETTGTTHALNNVLKKTDLETLQKQGHNRCHFLMQINS